MHCPLKRFRTFPKAKIDENLREQDDKCLVLFLFFYDRMDRKAESPRLALEAKRGARARQLQKSYTFLISEERRKRGW
jgi:hypothetical protein